MGAWVEYGACVHTGVSRDAATGALTLDGGRLPAAALSETAERLARAVADDPQDGQAQLNLGSALQGLGRHAEAVERFKVAQASRPNDAAPCLHIAISLLALGDAGSALRAASDACRRAPNEPRAHYAYGQAFTALGRHAEAERAFAAAVQLAPRWADAWLNYGVARYRQGAIDDAKTAMRHVLSFEPGHAAATSNLAAFMRIGGEIETAEALLRETLAREPGNTGVRLNLAADLLSEERPGEALALLDAAEPPTHDLPVVRHWLLQKSLALLQLQRPGEARAALAALAALGPIPPDIEPLWHWRHVLLAGIEGDAVGAREAAQRMETALAVMGPTPCPSIRSWRVTISRNSGRARVRRRVLSRAGPRPISFLP